MKFKKNNLAVRQRGQAMTEYALMALAMTAVCWLVFEAFMVAYQMYMKAFMLLLILPVP